MNVTTMKDNYIDIPYKMLAEVFSALEAFVLGTVYSFGKKGNTCRYGYDKFAKRLNVSRSTVARKIKRIKERPDVTVRRHGGAASEYVCTYELNGAYIRLPLWLCSTTFKIRGSERFLTPSEQLVYALIYTHTRAGNGTGVLESSPMVISKMLCDVVKTPTVKKALATLCWLGLVKRKKKGINGHQLSEYQANMKYFRSIERKFKKEEKSKNSIVSAMVQAQNKKSEIERFYSIQKTAAVIAAENYKGKAFKISPEFERLDKEMNALIPKVERAKFSKLENAGELDARLKKVMIERADVMRRFGIDERLFKYEEHCVCKNCYESGYGPDGLPCDCYLKRQM